MKTSKAYFNRFKKEFLRWQTLLGLTQYRACFHIRKLNDLYAEIEINEEGKIACIAIDSELNIKDNIGPEGNARHELLHLLTHKLVYLCKCRYVRYEEIQNEWESIVVRLEKVLK